MDKKLDRHVKSDKAMWAVVAVVLSILIILVVGLLTCFLLKTNPVDWGKAKNSNVAFAYDEGDAQSEDGIDGQSDSPSKAPGGPVITFIGLTLSLNPNGGTISGSSSIKVQNTVTAADLPSATRKGYVFGGWYTDYACNTAFVSAAPEDINRTQQLYAKWTANTYTLTFVTNGGNDIASRQVKAGESITLPTPTKERYIFDGWYSNAELINQVYSGFSIVENTTLYAKYHVDPQYLGSLPEEPQVEGYTFAGWYKDEALTVPYNGDIIWADTVLYAKMIPNKYTITFDSAGGTEIGNMQVEYNNAITLPSNPELKGYTFLGWYFSDGTQYTNQPVTRDVTLTAMWEIIQYKVTFMVNGEIYREVMVDYGTGLTEVAAIAEVYSMNVLSYRFADASIEATETDVDKVLVLGDMEVEAKEPSAQDKVVGGLTKVGNGIKDNWKTIVFAAGCVILVAIVISVIATLCKGSRRRRR